jgi:hypothetical protein
MSYPPQAAINSAAHTNAVAAIERTKLRVAFS